MEKKFVDEIRITAVVNKPPYFRKGVFNIPVDIQEVEIPPNLQEYLNKPSNTLKADSVEINLRHTDEITFGHILPITNRKRIAFYPGLKGIEEPSNRRPAERIEILDGPDVLAIYESK